MTGDLSPVAVCRCQRLSTQESRFKAAQPQHLVVVLSQHVQQFPAEVPLLTIRDVAAASTDPVGLVNPDSSRCTTQGGVPANALKAVCCRFVIRQAPGSSNNPGQQAGAGSVNSWKASTRCQPAGACRSWQTAAQALSGRLLQPCAGNSATAAPAW